jgi:guanylate kinase
MYPFQKLIIITAPSGAGKTSIVKKLMDTDLPLGFSVSACTRKQRAGEENGKDYYFISTEDFLHKIANHEFAEFEEVYAGSYYGTLKSEIQRIWNEENKSVLFDIDVQGALRLKNNFGETALTIFIKPPSFEILVERLTQRNTESEESLKKRIDKASLELTFESKFDVVIENIVLEDAFMEAKNIIHKFLF